MARRMFGVCVVMGVMACSGGGAGSVRDDDAGDAAAVDVQIPPADEGPALDAGARLDVVTVDAPTADVARDAGYVLPDAPRIEAPLGAWTWVDVPGARCANGRQTGFGVNLSDDPTQLLIFLQGGGACWDATTCVGPVSTSFFVATGYGRTEFNLDVLRAPMLPLQRWNPANPFRAMNAVYVPYCTGDVHAGTRVVRYRGLLGEQDFYHVGARNLDLFLQRIAVTFPRVRRVWLVGDSAGGFGSALNMDRVQRALPWSRVDVLDDSGPPVQPAGDRWSQWRAQWGVEFPVGCTTCGDDIQSVADFLRDRYPDHRFGLISYSYDAIISTFMGLDGITFHNRLTSFTDHMGHTWTNGRSFVIPGVLHVGLATSTPALQRWIQAMITDDPSWASVSP